MNKLFFITIILWITALHGFSQAVITNTPVIKDIKIDFGAVGDGIADDTWAFIKAGKYFSNRWDINGSPLLSGANINYAVNSGQLNIPSGTYKVGKQVSVPCGGLTTTYGAVFGYGGTTAAVSRAANTSFKYGFELIVLDNNINQMKIVGTGVTKPVIVYSTGLYLGYFNCSGTAQYNTTNGAYVTNIGSFISAANCQNLAVQNIDLNGNNQPANTNYGGSWDVGEGIQTGGSGLYLTNVQKISLTDMNIKYMTLDGVVIQDYYKDPSVFPGQPTTDAVLSNIVCDYNRRQGFSWVGGRNVLVQNSKFNNTGVTTKGTDGFGNPGAGVDIEPESDGTNWLWCMDGVFTNCEFINNEGCAMVCDEAAARAKTVTFNFCTFHDVSGYSVWSKGKAFTFNDSKVWGGFVYGNSGTVAGEETRFFRCDFADEEVVSRPGVYNAGYALVESWQTSKKMLFDNCTFRTLHANQRLAAVITPSSAEADYNVFSNCQFTVSSISNGDNILFGIAFDKNNTIISNNTSAFETINLNGVVFTGSTDPCNPYTFKMSGQVKLFPANSNGWNLTQFQLGRRGLGTSNTDGFCDFLISEKSCLYTYWSQTIDVGKNSRFINGPNGQLVTLDGTFNNAGKIIFDDNSYSAFNYAWQVNTAATGAPEFYFHKNAHMAVNSTWVPVFGGWGTASIASMSITPNTFFDGGNTTVPTAWAASETDALEFDGTNDYVDLGNTAAKLASYANSGFSVEIAFKNAPLSGSTVLRPLFSQGYNMSIGITRHGEIYFKLPDGAGGNTTTVISGAIDPGLAPACHVLVFTRSALNVINVYLDKVLIYSSPVWSVLIPASSADVTFIGRERFTKTTYYYYKGWIGQVKLWNRELTQADICFDHMRKAPYNATGLVADWDLTDSPLGTTAADAISPAANGTLTNGPVWLTQNTVGDCLDNAGINNAGYINFRTISNATIIHNAPQEQGENAGINVTFVSPNPNTGTFILDAGALPLTHPLVRIYDVNGKVVWQQQYINEMMKSFRKKIDLKCGTGTYFVKVTDGVKIYSQKIMIIR
jgi:hypothetical protein